MYSNIGNAYLLLVDSLWVCDMLNKAFAVIKELRDTASGDY